MKTMKKFWKYFLNFVVLMLLVTALTYLGTMKYNKESNQIQCITQTELPAIEVTETTNKKVTGTITNDTNVLINAIYVKAEFFNEDGKLLGTEYDEIKYFNVGEKAKFEIKHSYKNVSIIKLTTTDKKD